MVITGRLRRALPLARGVACDHPDPDQKQAGAVMKIRSELMVHDLNAGTDTVVYQSSELIEAPNWSPDGRYLLINGGGLLYRFDLATRQIQQVDTGFAVTLNNDHGISPDGRWIVVSDKTEFGLSCIYVIPAAGGAPRRVTENLPSYWHGWSPDMKTLAYCARREGIYGVYTCAVDGTGEQRLTPQVGHSDGPDYAPDGAWIWYNSSATGTMQIHRMRSDGSNDAAMTTDNRVNWFPHPSPDGKSLLYLSYPPGTEYHPRDLPVELRLLDLQQKSPGTAPRTLVRLFGGQGSINVPCWAPDGNRFAYMRYYPAG